MRITVNGHKYSGVIIDILKIAFNHLPFDIPDDIREDIKLATNEALVNAIKYGGDNVYIDIEINAKHFLAMIRDSGEGFNWRRYTIMPDPEAECGRGIPLMLKLMDKVEYNNTGNCVLLVRNLTRGEQ